MHNELYRSLDYLEYLLTADSRHGVHSPFVYKLIDEVIYGRQGHAAFDLIEQIRKEMIDSSVRIEFDDLGGGNRSGLRKLSGIASATAREAKYGRLLFRLLQFFKPEFCIELGTGTGITAMYQAAALGPTQKIYTIEGSPKLAEIARYNFEKSGLNESIISLQGDFAQVLPSLLSSLPKVDFAYIDGNHRLQPTLEYFELLLAKCHTHSVLVFDDINWSQEMKRAWNTIKNHPTVTVTIDLFAFGIVFFRLEQEKEHFKIRY